MQENPKRYSRHFKLEKVGVEGQERLSAKSVLVIGAGGLGCPVLQSIVSAGIGRVGIVDGDLVSESNLQRQFLFNLDDIGKSKCLVAAQKLGELNPLVDIETYDFFINEDSIVEILKDYDIIADCTDNMEAKYLINDAAVQLAKPVVFGALHTFQGQVGVYNYKNSNTYRCIFPNNQAQLESQNCSEVGVWSVLPGIIGTMQANEILKMSGGLNGVLVNKIGIYDSLSVGIQFISVVRNDDQVKIALKRSFKRDPIEKRRLNKSDFMNRAQSEESIVLDLSEQREQPVLESSESVHADDIDNWKTELPKNKKILLFCNRGNTSLKVLRKLVKEGYDAYDLKRGINN